MKLVKIMLQTAFVMLVALNCSAQEAERSLEAKIDEYMQPYLQMSQFSGSMLLARGGEVLVAKGFGMANLEHDAPNSPQTKFRLGSITKQFTATCILQLQERGLLSVQDPLSRYIADYPRGDEITIHHLLTHTSGIPELLEIEGFNDRLAEEMTLEEIIGWFRDLDLEFTPGEQFSYSNSGYVLLTQIIEEVSGQGYEEYLRRNVLDPLGLENTGYDRRAKVLPHRADGYALTDDGLRRADYIDMSLPVGGGALYSTVEDMYIWDRALYTDQVLSAESRQQMFTAFKSDYAYGWITSPVEGREAVAHGGGINGFCAWFMRFVEDDACIVVLSNIENAPISRIAADLAKILLGEPYEVPQVDVTVSVSPEILQRYVGDYRMSERTTVSIKLENGELFIVNPGQPTFQLYAESETKFFLKVIPAKIEFQFGEDGHVSGMVVVFGENEMLAERIR